MIIYLDDKFNPTTKEKAIIAKVIPEDGKPPYFIRMKEDAGKEKKNDKQSRTGETESNSSGQADRQALRGQRLAL